MPVLTLRSDKESALTYDELDENFRYLEILNTTGYIHPSEDGDLHVPATGTTNEGKVLTAGSTAGSLSWTTPSSSGTLPEASSSALGGIKIGYVANAKNYPIQLSSGKAFVNVPWTEGNGSSYELPKATATDLGGIKVGSNLSIDAATGILSSTDTNTDTIAGLTDTDITGTIANNSILKYSNVAGKWVISTSPDTYTGFGLISISTTGVISTTAEENVQSNWTAASGDSAILNKPTNFAVDTNGFVGGPTAGDQTAGKILDANNNWIDKPTNGTNGKTVLSGNGAPASTLGVVGDFYIDTATQEIYGAKAAGVWGTGIDLNGTNGNGISGSSYNASDGTITLTFDDTTTTVTGDLRGASGTNGNGISGSSYNSGTGEITLTFDDTTTTVTGDLRGASGATWSSGVGSPITNSVSGVDGDFYLNTTDESVWKMGVTTTGEWENIITTLSGSGSGASVVISDTPPINPNSGDLWTDSTDMSMFIYYEDGDSSQWVGVSGSAGGGGGGYTHPDHSGDVVSNADGATTIQPGAVDIAMLSATGTASATTFLRGDNTWVVPTIDAKGWTSGSYNASDGIITFTSDDGLGFVTNDLRGASTVATTLANGLMSSTHFDQLALAVNHYGSTHAPSGIFTQDNDGHVNGPTAADVSAGKILDANNNWIVKPTDGTNGNGISGSSYNSGTGEITLTFDTTADFTTGDLRRPVGAIASGSNDIVSSGTLYTAFDGKASTGHTHSGYAASSHGIHVPSSTTQGYVLTAGATAGSLAWAAPAGGASVVISDTPPANPNSGDLWTDSTNMSMFIYYGDGDSSQWVGVSGSAGGGTASAILPVAQARLSSASAGTGAGISWGTYNPSNGEIQFTFNTPELDNNYSVIINSSEDDLGYDHLQIQTTSKTTTGFKIISGDAFQGQYIDPASYPFSIVVYSSDPVQTITSDSYTPGGNISISGNDISSTNTNGDITLTPDGTGKVNINNDSGITIGKPITGVEAVARATALEIQGILVGVTYHTALNSLLQTTAGSTNFDFGDLDNDGDVDISDSTKALRIFTRITSPGNSEYDWFTDYIIPAVIADSNISDLYYTGYPGTADGKNVMVGDVSSIINDNALLIRSKPISDIELEPGSGHTKIWSSLYVMDDIDADQNVTVGGDIDVGGDVTVGGDVLASRLGLSTINSINYSYATTSAGVQPIVSTADMFFGQGNSLSTSPKAKLSTTITTDASNVTTYSTGFHVDGDIVAHSTITSSDIKLKENITPVENALDKVNQLRGVEFNWKKDGTKSAGVIAQDVEKVLPQAVKTVEDLNTKEEYRTVKYDSLHALLIEAIKEQTSTINELKSRIDSLENSSGN